MSDELGIYRVQTNKLKRFKFLAPQFSLEAGDRKSRFNQNQYPTGQVRIQMLGLRKSQIVRIGSIIGIDVCKQVVRSLCSKRLVLTEFGDPIQVLKYEAKHDVGSTDGKLVVKMVAAPINPADINVIQGTYALKPTEFPAVNGLEGVGVVDQIGSGPNPFGLTVGQLVIPRFPGIGTWQSHIIEQNENFLPISNKLDHIAAATLSVNPCTAYRLLQDFETLVTDDTIIQNGGNSAVGQAVIQLCRILGYKSISIVRDRPNIGKLKSDLHGLGDNNTQILTEEELRKNFKTIRAKLALNCVGGKSATDILRTLEPSRSMITYGGMSRLPITIPTTSLIFNDVHLKGFWMTRWTKTNPVETRLQMLNHLSELCVSGQFKPPQHQTVPIQEYERPITKLLEGFAGTKYIFTFD